MKKIFCVLFVSLFLFTFAFSDESVIDPVGRWTIRADYSEMTENFLYSKADLLFFEDGTVYELYVKKDKHDDLSVSFVSGIWLCNSDSIVLRISDKTYKCLIDSDGSLLLYLGPEAHLTYLPVNK